MRTIVLGSGPMGRAVAAGLEGRGDDVTVLGRPRSTHPPGAFDGIDVVFDFSRGDGVLPNLASGLAGGCRRYVVGTTAWTAGPVKIGAILAQYGAAAVAAANFSPGVNMLARLVESASYLFGPLPAYDPYVVEWHRRGKADRPSGTALELSRRILAAHPGKARIADHARPGAAEADELEVSSVRAGSSPGMHVVGFDAPGETLELRLTARDRSAYVLGALAAADWLAEEPRRPGLHGFDEVVDQLVGLPGTDPSSAPLRRRTGRAGRRMDPVAVPMA